MKASQNAGKFVPGSALVAHIRDFMKAEGLSNLDFSKMLGLSYTYVNSILSGNRWVGTLDRERMLIISRWLGIPLAQTLMLGEVMHPEDFIVTTGLDERLENVHRQMLSDPDWRGLVPGADEWNAAPQRMRLAMAVMFERLVERELIAKAQVVQVERG